MILDLNEVQDTKTFNLIYKGERTDMTYTLKNMTSPEMKALQRKHKKKEDRAKTQVELSAIKDDNNRELFIEAIVDWTNFKYKEKGSDDILEMPCTKENKGKLYDDGGYTLVVNDIVSKLTNIEDFF